MKSGPSFVARRDLAVLATMVPTILFVEVTLLCGLVELEAFFAARPHECEPPAQHLEGPGDLPKKIEPRRLRLANILEIRGTEEITHGQAIERERFLLDGIAYLVGVELPFRA